MRQYLKIALENKEGKSNCGNSADEDFRDKNRRAIQTILDLLKDTGISMVSDQAYIKNTVFQAFVPLRNESFLNYFLKKTFCF